MQPVLGSKSVKSDYSPLFVDLAFQNRLQYRTSDFKTFFRNKLATSCKNLVRLCPVTPHLKTNYLKQIISGSTALIFTKFHHMVDI